MKVWHIKSYNILLSGDGEILTLFNLMAFGLNLLKMGGRLRLKRISVHLLILLLHVENREEYAQVKQLGQMVQ